jgi:hypothetical protein
MGIGGIRQCALEGRIDSPGARYKLLTLITVITMPLMVIGTWYGRISRKFMSSNEIRLRVSNRNCVALYPIDGVVV